MPKLTHAFVRNAGLVLENLEVTEGTELTERLREIVTADINDLARWLPASDWPFHSDVRVTADWVLERAAAGMFNGHATRSFWYLRGETPVGIVRAFELEDVTPLLDLRIGAEFRRQGVGTGMLHAVTGLIFNEHPDLHRIGGYTRHDNTAMSRVFTKCGYVLEACHRRGWRIEGAKPVDALGYAILREDWARAPVAEPAQ